MVKIKNVNNVTCEQLDKILPTIRVEENLGKHTIGIYFSQTFLEELMNTFDGKKINDFLDIVKKNASEVNCKVDIDLKYNIVGMITEKSYEFNLAKALFKICLDIGKQPLEDNEWFDAGIMGYSFGIYSLLFPLLFGRDEKCIGSLKSSTTKFLKDFFKIYSKGYLFEDVVFNTEAYTLFILFAFNGFPQDIDDEEIENDAMFIIDNIFANIVDGLLMELFDNTIPNFHNLLIEKEINNES